MIWIIAVFTALFVAIGVAMLRRRRGTRLPQQEPACKLLIAAEACSLPTTAPTDGRLHMLELSPARSSGRLAEPVIVWNGPFTWPTSKDGTPPQAYKWEVVNGGDEPLIDVEATMRVRFSPTPDWENDPIKSGVRSSDLPFAIEIRRIDPGRASAFVFYVVNFSDQFAHAWLPETASFKTPGNARRRSIAVTFHAASHMTFVPLRR